MNENNPPAGFTVKKTKRPMSYRTMVQRPPVDYVEEEKRIEANLKRVHKKPVVPAVTQVRRRAPDIIVDVNDTRWRLLQEYVNCQVECSRSDPFTTATDLKRRLRTLYDFVRRKEINLADMTGSLTMDLLRELEARQLSKNQIKLTLQALRHFYNWALDNRKFQWMSNPIPQFLRINGTVRAAATLTWAHYEQLMRVYRGKDYWDYVFIFSWETGSRISDCCLLRWENVNWEKGFISFMPRKTKWRKIRVLIPMNEALTDILTKRKERDTKAGVISPFVCPPLAEFYQTKPYRVSESVTRAMKKAGLFNITHKAFRHGYVTRLLENGVPPAVVMSMSGHTNLKTAMSYMSVSLEAKRKAMEQASKPVNPSAPVEGWSEYLKQA